MTKVLVYLIFISSTLLADKIHVAAAANISNVMEELKREFAKTDPDTSVLVTFGSSGKLTAQIKNGAPYGLFMSANMSYPQALFDDHIATTKPRVYARGTLVYFSAKGQDFSKGAKLLESGSIGKIVIANPKTAPYGKASVEAMKKAKVYKRVKEKLVYAESISQALVYAVTAADMGLIAKSLLYSPKMNKYKKEVNWHPVETDLYTPIEQGAVLLKNAQEKRAYKSFYDFILGAPGKSIFKKYGYII